MAVNLNDLTNPRQPGHLEWRPPQRLSGFLAPGVIIAANDTNGCVVAVLGSGRIRIAAKFSAAGNLRLRWRLADHMTDLATVASSPADTAVVANTELVIDIPANPGHAYLEITNINGAAPSTVAYVDVFQTPYGN